VLVLLATGVMGLMFFIAPNSAHAQEACYPPGAATCPSTSTTEAVSPTEATTEATSGSELARTGSDTTVPYTAIAAVLIAGGGLAVVATRKRARNNA
jgi:LPXTG-motif cell wall-anchored protein